MIIKSKLMKQHMKDHSVPLVELLQKHISLNLSRAKCLGIFIIAMLNCRTVNMAILCNAMPSEIKASSWYRRMQRFISEISISWKVLPLMLVVMTGLEKQEKWVLCLDRTNWKFGKRYINILYLGASFHGIAIPLFGVF
uniref:transposase n=1 Tax=Candidatus Trichorickettsia mobilis TaxID=1346319 RepID=UPI002930E445|nr:transposase [Candidatus Trichorickettsia mobilis]